MDIYHRFMRKTLGAQL